MWTACYILTNFLFSILLLKYNVRYLMIMLLFEYQFIASTGARKNPTRHTDRQVNISKWRQTNALFSSTEAENGIQDNSKDKNKNYDLRHYAWFHMKSASDGHSFTFCMMRYTFLFDIWKALTTYIFLFLGIFKLVITPITN